MPSYLIRVAGGTDAASERESQQQQPLWCGKRRGQEIRWKAQRPRVKGSLGKRDFFFFPRYHSVFTRHQMHTSRAQRPSRFFLGVPRDYQYQMGRNLLFSTVSLLLFAPWCKSPCFFSCVFFSSTQLDIRRLTSLLPLNFYIWNNVDGPKE